MTDIFNEAVFSPAFPFDGPHLVAASAGTGKTHNIQNVCARLAMERGLRVSEILVMTFTEAATKELRDRIRKVFSNLQRLFSGDTAGLDAGELERLAKLRACARAALGGAPEAADATARRRVELALLEFDQAAISTIHGFCRRVLARFAFETGGAFRAEFGDDGGAELARRARDWWRVNKPAFPLAGLSFAVNGLGRKHDWTVENDPESGKADPCLEAARAIAAKYEADRAVREEQTFDDLLRSVRATLADPVRGPALAKRLREEFKAVVVDEFQDTDPTQYGIFRKAFIEGAPDGARPPIFFVGDPKQAIYSFRGGDIYAYRAAATSPEIAGASWRLDRNFRSTPKLVDAVNRLFGDAKAPDGAIEARTFGDDAIPYDEDVKAQEADGGRIEGLAVAGPDGGFAEDPHPFRVVRAGNSAERGSAVVDAVLETLAEQRGRTIRTKAGEEPFGPGHIAVLVTANEKARALGAALRAKGVPAVVPKSGNVFAGQTAAEFRLVLAAMADAEDRRLVRTALATPFFGVPAAELENDADDAFAAKAELFFRLNRTWTKRGFNAAFAELEDECGLRARFAALPDGERRLADLFQIVDLANAAIRERGPAPDALVAWIADRIRLSADKDAEGDSEEYARELESDADAVKIMTVHSAKGLEFPVVVVPIASPWNGRRQDEPDSVHFHHDAAGNLLAGGPWARADEEAEAAAEKTRLLYVALTRATRRTVAVATGEPIPAFSRILDNARRHGAGEDNPPDSPLLWSDYEPRDLPRWSGLPEREGAGEPQLAAAETPRDYAPFRKSRKGSYSSLSPSPRDAGAGGSGGGNGAAEAAAAEDRDDGRDRDENESEAPPPLRDAEEDGGGDAAAGAGEPCEHPIFAIGGGANTGTCWHDILEKIPIDATDDAIREATLRSMRIHGLAKGEGKELDRMVATVSGMIRATLLWPVVAPDGTVFSLRDVPMERRFSEWEFDFPSKNAADRTPAIAAILKDEWKDDPGKAEFLRAVENWDREIPKGFLVGFIDLMFEHGGRFYVVDWKSNKLDGRAASFSEAGVRAEMAREGYFFQYLLYAAVMHRFLRETMGEAYSWERHFGGVRYYFLRGIAAGGEVEPVFADRPPERLLDRLCKALGLEDR